MCLFFFRKKYRFEKLLKKENKNQLFNSIHHLQLESFEMVLVFDEIDEHDDDNAS